MWNKIFNKNKSTKSTSPSNELNFNSSTSLPASPLSKSKTKLKKKNKFSVLCNLTLKSNKNNKLNDEFIEIVDETYINHLQSPPPSNLIRKNQQECENDVIVNHSPAENGNNKNEQSGQMKEDDLTYDPRTKNINNSDNETNCNDFIDNQQNNMILHPCPICSRTFNPAALAKHVGICEKTTTKKRKIFDSSRQRREGTDLALLPPKPEFVKITQPKIIHQPRKSIDSSSQSLIIRERKESLSRESPVPKVVKRNLAPVTDQCPHCERFFGVKAYDRHVEWCKEKARLNTNNNHQLNQSVSIAKERLEARTKYKAPPLRTKRAFNREKYSGAGGDDSSSINLSDLSGSMSMNRSLIIGSMKNSMQNSMTSSTTSEGALSDSYDPFLSAKRQLEELFSPPPHKTSTPSSVKSTISKSYNTPTTSSIARSVPNSTNLNSYKSNFKRTSSLRLPKTTTTIATTLSKQPNYLFSNKRPTIQRGISIDDGPLSHNFLKSSEFDELPVKSACVNPSSVSHSNKHSPASPLKPLLRDPNTVQRRKDNIKLELRRPEGNQDLSKTDSLAVFLKYEHELSLSPTLTEKEIKDKNNIFNKRISNSDKSPNSHNSSSNDLRNDKTPMIDPSNSSIFIFPDIKDTSNYIDPKLINLCDNLPINVTKISSDTSDSNSSDSNETTTGSNHNNNNNNNNNNSNCNNNHINNNNYNNSNNNNINSNHILNNNNSKINNNDNNNHDNNSCLLISNNNHLISTNNDNNNNLSPNNQNQHKDALLQHFLHETITKKTPSPLTLTSTPQTTSTIDSRRLKRQMKLSKDTFLYDRDIYSEQCDKVISMIETSPPSSEISNDNVNVKNNNNIQTLNNNNNQIYEPEKLFENFDLDEFISSFEDDEKYPIFKDYKEFKMHNLNFRSSKENLEDGKSKMKIEDIKNNNNNNNVHNHQQQFSNRHNNNNNNNSHRNLHSRHQEENELNLLIKQIQASSKNDNLESPLSSPPPPPIPPQPRKLEEINEAHKELLKSIQDLDRLQESSSTMYPVDSDEMSSVESFPINANNSKAGSKFSADSAYGSLSRQSPIEPTPIQRVNRRHIQRSRQQQLYSFSQLDKSAKFMQNNNVSTKPRDNNGSLSSSESETSLPQIQSPKIDINEQKEIRNSSSSGSEMKMSKFCHECGSKFLISSAKFCMECGVRRMVLE